MLVSLGAASGYMAVLLVLVSSGRPVGRRRCCWCFLRWGGQWVDGGVIGACFVGGGQWVDGGVVGACFVGGSQLVDGGVVGAFLLGAASGWTAVLLVLVSLGAASG